MENTSPLWDPQIEIEIFTDEVLRNHFLCDSPPPAEPAESSNSSPSRILSDSLSASMREEQEMEQAPESSPGCVSGMETENDNSPQQAPPFQQDMSNLSNWHISDLSQNVQLDFGLSDPTAVPPFPGLEVPPQFVSQSQAPIQGAPPLSNETTPIDAQLFFQDCEDRLVDNWFHPSDNLEVVTTSSYRMVMTFQVDSALRAQQAASELLDGFNETSLKVVFTSNGDLRPREKPFKRLKVFARRNSVLIEMRQVNGLPCSYNNGEEPFWFEVVDQAHTVVFITTRKSTITTVSKKKPSPRKFQQRKTASIDKRNNEQIAQIDEFKALMRRA